MMDSNQYCVLWNNYHGSLVETIGGLRKDGQLLDVTVVCSDGNQIPAHQLVLAACSTFFRDFIKGNPSKHPIVLLPSDIQYAELKSMIEFMYTGQVCIQQEKLQAFIKGARYLRIKGLDDTNDESELEENCPSDSEKMKADLQTNNNGSKTTFSDSNIPDEVPTTTIKGKKVKDHRYTQQVDLGDSDENREKWEVIDRKPIIFPQNHSSSPGLRRRRRKFSSMRKRPMHISNSIVCYERKNKSSSTKYDTKEEPINKIRRVHQEGHFHDDDLDLCTCTARKIWSVKDTEALLKAWRETLTQVPPSYFIRSMSLCKSVAKRLQQRGVKKNWRQCQVKMKNLRREVRLFKEGITEKSNSRKPSEVANACEKLLPYIEDIFMKEEAIRTEWYQLKADRGTDDIRMEEEESGQHDILAQAAVLADSDLCDEDTDVPPIETEGEGCGLTEAEGAFTEGEEGVDEPFVTTVTDPHRMHVDEEVTVHHIVEGVSLNVITKEEPVSSSDI